MRRWTMVLGISTILLSLGMFFLVVPSSSGQDVDLAMGEVPIRVVQGARGGSIEFCALRHDLRSENPAKYPMFKFLVSESGCNGRTKRYSFEAVEAWLDKTEKENPGRYITEPSGFVFHEARCGSTLAANILAAMGPMNVVYSESSPPAEIVLHSSLDREGKVKALRTVMRAMGRVPQAERLYFKFQSALSQEIGIVREAFPNTPFLFVHRDSVEVMASLLGTDGAHGHEPGTVLQGPLSPCTRGIRQPSEEHLAVLKMSRTEARGATAEQFCGAHLSVLLSRAELNIADAAAKAKENPPMRGVGVSIDYKDMPDNVIEAVKKVFGQEVTEEMERRAREVAGVYSKSPSVKFRGDPQEFKGDAELKQSTAPQTVQHQARTVVEPVRSKIQSFSVEEAARLVSMADSLGASTVQPASPERSLFGRLLAGEAGIERELAAAEIEMAVWEEAQLRDKGLLAHQEGRNMRAARKLYPSQPTEEAFASELPQGAPRRLDDGTPLEEYPRLFPLPDILDDWNPDDMEVPETYSKEYRHMSLRIFDFTDPDEIRQAETYRRAEVPFVARGVPSLMDANGLWTDSYLNEVMGSHKKMAEKSKDNHFMYYSRSGGKMRGMPSNYAPPQEEVYMTFAEWLDHAYSVDQAILEDKTKAGELEHYYFRASSKTGSGRDSLPVPGKDAGIDNRWISSDLELYRSRKSFFIVDPRNQRGIHCRFGVAGIIAEAHYDGGRNFISVIRGRRRYILAPASQCPNLDILDKGPSSRHSATDWSNPEQYHENLAKAKALEVVLEPGDSLFVPAWWFHLPISLTTNIQCNSRSGSPAPGGKELEECGFPIRVTERPFQTTYENRPLYPAPAAPTPAPTPVDPKEKSRSFKHDEHGVVPAVEPKDEKDLTPSAVAAGGDYGERGSPVGRGRTGDRSQYTPGRPASEVHVPRSVDFDKRSGEVYHHKRQTKSTPGALFVPASVSSTSSVDLTSPTFLVAFFSSVGVVGVVAAYIAKSLRRF